MSVASGNKVLPTKIGLIQTKRSLRTSRSVYKILEDKREVLLKRLDEMINEAQKSRDDMWDPLSEAYRRALRFVPKTRTRNARINRDQYSPYC